MKIYNTLSARLETIETREPGKISIYLCGPTVQGEPHLGHGRAAVAFDVIRRYLRWHGYQVTFVQNVTDVEDKIIAAALERGISTEELATEMNGRFDAAYRALNVERPDVEPKATDHIPDMLELIETLIDRELAYPAGGDVYFSVRSLPDYGKLSRHNLDDLIAGARVEVGDTKRDPLDFALWKAAKADEPQWESPWGPGRPGWHIECSAMASRYLGPGFDIHGGGADLIFPHHENEIAQSEGAGVEPFAQYWAHNGMLNLGGEKMAKSTGHVIGLEQAIERFGAIAVRLFYLRAQYRSPLEYSEELLEDAVSALGRLRAFHRRAGSPTAEADSEMMGRFREAMEDDFNTPLALAVLFDIVREGNRKIDAAQGISGLATAFHEITGVLGLSLVDQDGGNMADLIDLAQSLGIDPDQSYSGTVDRLVAARQRARASQDWAVSDTIRDRLAELGVIVEDTSDGARWHRE